jgi:hypothetical protein
MGDSLVLKIDEYDYETDMNVNTMFVLYDKHHYIIRGEKTNCRHGTIVPYSFNCTKHSQLADFILAMSSDDKELQYSLYVHPDLPLDSSYITYDSLAANLGGQHELAFKKTNVGLKPALLVVKNVFNVY